ncbi:FimB/Mfa2 family fimbrial subunit [Parabacteroides bouchesdurhonensis]|uniref:FimB/Mfa2 family fimbrial subunit n=1 Tax=Parabacteroides bouchesdurhonensis TaxID=1936995 RepID=UPI000C8189E7|nr:FimB/Mfa2 family fimbrial subunit [Parabacteroides bouchesdurhonensis]
MKKKALLALAGILCLAGCQSMDTKQNTADKMYPVQFSVQLKKEILPFPEKRSIPAFSIPEPVLKESSPGDDTETPEEMLFNRIEYVVYDNTESPEKLIHHKQFIPTDEDFGIVYDSLPAGNYKIAFLAHSSATATLSDHTICFDKVSDTFHACTILPINGNETVRDEIELKRIVSRIEFVSEEAVPSNIKSLDITVKPYFSKVDLFTGKSTEHINSFSIPYSFVAEEKEQPAPTHSFYSLIPSGNETLSAILIAVDTDGSVIQQREINNITPIENKIIRYKGKLYSPKNVDETFTLIIAGEGAWDDPTEDIPVE